MATLNTNKAGTKTTDEKPAMNRKAVMPSSLTLRKREREQLTNKRFCLDSRQPCYGTDICPTSNNCIF